MMRELSKQIGRVGVLMGGVSSEREISLQSGNAIIESLHRQGIHVVPIDIMDSREGRILFLLQEANIDLAFIALHGQLGEDGTIQSILEKMNIPYTGSNGAASRVAFDKALTQNVFKKNNINIPSYVTLSSGQPPNGNTIIEELKTFPLIVKPACEGSSFGISLVNTRDELDRALKLAWQYGATVLLEQYIRGRELTVGILGQEALPVIEIRPKHHFFDFEAKYTKGMTDYIIPAAISESLTQDIQRVALNAHQILGCDDFSRVDLMVDADQKYYVLEINTIPGFTSTSLLPKAALRHGYDFDQLCFKLMELAYGKKKEIKDTPLC